MWGKQSWKGLVRTWLLLICRGSESWASVPVTRPGHWLQAGEGGLHSVRGARGGRKLGSARILMSFESCLRLPPSQSACWLGPPWSQPQAIGCPQGAALGPLGVDAGETGSRRMVPGLSRRTLGLPSDLGCPPAWPWAPSISGTVWPLPGRPSGGKTFWRPHNPRPTLGGLVLPFATTWWLFDIPFPSGMGIPAALGRGASVPCRCVCALACSRGRGNTRTRRSGGAGCKGLCQLRALGCPGSAYLSAALAWR